MYDFSSRTLILAIQAVAAKQREILAEVNGDISHDDFDHEMYVAYELAAAELKTAYEKACATISRLPAYESLV